MKSFQGTRFRQWATRVLREMLLNRLDEIKRIARLERRVDAAESDIKQIKGGVSYLVQQLSAPPDPSRRRIGFEDYLSLTAQTTVKATWARGSVGRP